MNAESDGYEISTDPARLDLDFICRSLTTTYWAKDRPRPMIEEGFRNSLCFGLYHSASRSQVGMARVVSDKATFSWLCDVFVDKAHQGKGLGTWLVSTAIAHPLVKDTIIHLGTQDAHGLYEKFGFVRSEQMKRIPRKASEGAPIV